jgi:hypothetical protein
MPGGQNEVNPPLLKCVKGFDVSYPNPVLYSLYDVVYMYCIISGRKMAWVCAV